VTSANIRRLVAVVVTAVLLTSGCASTIAGSAVKVGAGEGTNAPAPPGPSGPKVGVPPATITEQVGVLAVPTVLSHEMGHLVQDRLGVDTEDVLLLEQQADCYAGSYWRWVADGHSTYFDINQTDGIRQVLTAMMSTGDPVGTTPSTEGAHGSGFDRSYAFTLGYSNGAVRCSKITSAEVQARITETGFTDQPQNYGNVEITADFINQLATVVDAYFTTTVKGYKPPTLTPFDGATGPGCAGAPTQFPVGYCPSSNSITYNLAELRRIGTPTAGFQSTNGDFSAILILVSRYGLAAQATTGGTAVGNRAGLKGLCYAGSWASWMRKPQGAQRLTLTPNDLDKAVFEVLASPPSSTRYRPCTSASSSARGSARTSTRAELLDRPGVRLSRR
jgi:predicted metalloprotease